MAANLSSVTVVTDSAITNHCGDNCPAKSLQNYVQGNGGFAGINGIYSCPSDYASCAGKVNAFDFPICNPLAKKWVFWDNDERNLL